MDGHYVKLTGVLLLHAIVTSLFQLPYEYVHYPLSYSSEVKDACKDNSDWFL